MTNLVASSNMESVGEDFQESLIAEARHQTLRIIEEATKEIGPGVSEDQGRQIVKSLLQKNHCDKSWHAPQVRFGVNTLRGFGEPGVPGVVLGANDIYFLDIGPVFGIHEGDVGRTFAFGNDAEMNKLAIDAETIWKRVRDRWFETQDTGARLYEYAERISTELGWQLLLDEAKGHRIADFPHAAKQRSAIDGLDFKPSPNKWILEIQLRHPTRSFGAFYEDLLI
jgi:methionyl aminopeptidase